MWRSEPSISTIDFSSSGSVAMWSSALLHGFSHDFFNGGHAVLDLAESACPQREHPFIDRLPAQLETGGAHQNQLAQFLAHLHHFVQADAALVPCRIADLASGAFARRHAVGVVLVEPRLHERLRRHGAGLLAVAADAAE